MRQLILFLNLILFTLLLGCGNRDRKIYIYDRYTMQGKPLNQIDTLILEKDINNDSTYFVTIHLYGYKKEFTVIHKKEHISIKTNDSIEVLYTIKDHGRHINSFEKGLMDIFPSFYHVNYTQFCCSGFFTIRGKDYVLQVYKVKANSSVFELVFYVPEFGFIMRFEPETENFKRLIKIESSDKTENELAMKLIDKILADTQFSVYPLRPVFKDFEPPSSKRNSK